MPNANDLVRLIKQAALDAVEAKKPVNVCYGKVTKASPLRILVEQKLPLAKEQLVLARNVTDYVTTVSISAEYDKKKITIHNGLVEGDEVILIRQQDGQKYIVVDRLR